MTLDQLMKLEGIEDYYIWWYGADYPAENFDENGYSNSKTLDVARGAGSEDRVYLVIHGLDAFRARYKFAVKICDPEDGNKYHWKKIPLSLDQYSDRLIFRCNHRFTFYNSGARAADFNIEAIIPPEGVRTVDQFRDYDSVELTFPQLKEVVEN